MQSFCFGVLFKTPAELPREIRHPFGTVQVNTPFPFEGRLGYVGHGDHLLSWSDPHDGAVVALRGALQPQTGVGSPRQSPLREKHQNQVSKRGRHSVAISG